MENILLQALKTSSIDFNIDSDEKYQYELIANGEEKIVDSIKFIFLLLIEATTFPKSDTLSNKTNKLLCWIILQVIIIIWYYKG